jgi:hypothetical protein
LRVNPLENQSPVLRGLTIYIKFKPNMHVTDAIMDGVHINEEMREINQMLHDFSQAFRLRSVYAAKMSKCENI